MISNRLWKILVTFKSCKTLIATAERLFVSRDTVKKHLANVYAKLGVHSKQELQSLIEDGKIVR